MAAAWAFLVKIFYGIISVPLIIVVGLISFLGLDSCGAEPPNAKWVESAFDLNLDGATVDEAWDNHGGFVGDGETYIALTFQESLEEQITAINEEYIGETKCGGPWYSIGEYPLAYAGLLEEIKDFRGGGTGTPISIEVGNGYFAVINNFDNKDEYVFLSEDKNLGGFWNWEIAIYDIDEMKLYYYEMDM